MVTPGVWPVATKLRSMKLIEIKANQPTINIKRP